VRVDYAAGAVEEAVLAAAAGAGPSSWLLVEGQGSFCHPGSTATLPLLRGAQPTDLLLAHRAGQTAIRNQSAIPLPPLPELIVTLEGMAALGRPAGVAPPRLRAIALNTGHLESSAAVAALDEVAAATGLACFDPVRDGGDALLAHLRAMN
jgi:uncharacterized NAD-dependent epimerase/dehydratase family protein